MPPMPSGSCKLTFVSALLGAMVTVCIFVRPSERSRQEPKEEDSEVNGSTARTVRAAGDPLIVTPLSPGMGAMLHRTSQRTVCSRNANLRSPDYFPFAPGRFRNINKHLPKDTIESFANNVAIGFAIPNSLSAKLRINHSR
jgi:hypothetical protein